MKLAPLIAMLSFIALGAGIGATATTGNWLYLAIAAGWFALLTVLNGVIPTSSNRPRHP